MHNVNYALHVSLQPKINKGAMAHYWHISITTPDGVFTIADGWEEDVYSATHVARREARKRGIVK